MKIEFTLASVLFLLSVAHAQTSGLEGVWVLDKERTLQSLERNNVQLPPSNKANLDSSYGVMAYVFKGNRTTYTPKNRVDDQPVWYTWKVDRASSSEIVIRLQGLEELIEFGIYDTCLGLEITEYKYVEYYCKND